MKMFSYLHDSIVVYFDFIYLTLFIISFYFIQAKLLPADDITVYYKATGDLLRVVPAYEEFIFATIKQPVKLLGSSSPTDVLITETSTVHNKLLYLARISRKLILCN